MPRWLVPALAAGVASVEVLLLGVGGLTGFVLLASLAVGLVAVGGWLDAVGFLVVAYALIAVVVLAVVLKVVGLEGPWPADGQTGLFFVVIALLGCLAVAIGIAGRRVLLRRRRPAEQM